MNMLRDKAFGGQKKLDDLLARTYELENRLGDENADPQSAMQDLMGLMNSVGLGSGQGSPKMSRDTEL